MKYYLFGKEGARQLAYQLEVPFLGEVPLIQSIREAGDVGPSRRPAGAGPFGGGLYRSSPKHDYLFDRPH